MGSLSILFSRNPARISLEFNGIRSSLTRSDPNFVGFRRLPMKSEPVSDWKESDNNPIGSDSHYLDPTRSDSSWITWGGIMSPPHSHAKVQHSISIFNWEMPVLFSTAKTPLASQYQRLIQHVWILLWRQQWIELVRVQGVLRLHYVMQARRLLHLHYPYHLNFKDNQQRLHARNKDGNFSCIKTFRLRFRILFLIQISSLRTSRTIFFVFLFRYTLKNTELVQRRIHLYIQ